MPRSRGEGGTEAVTAVGLTLAAGAVVTWAAWAACARVADGVAELAGEPRELRCIRSGQVVGVGAVDSLSG